jgi:hypothetical protein
MLGFCRLNKTNQKDQDPETDEERSAKQCKPRFAQIVSDRGRDYAPW